MIATLQAKNGGAMICAGVMGQGGTELAAEDGPRFCTSAPVKGAMPKRPSRTQLGRGSSSMDGRSSLKAHSLLHVRQIHSRSQQRWIALVPLRISSISKCLRQRRHCKDDESNTDSAAEPILCHARRVLVGSTTGEVLSCSSIMFYLKSPLAQHH